MLITILSSISKIAVVAFLFTFIAILIELYLISRKERVKKEKKDVVLPEFTEGVFKQVDEVKNSPIEIKKAAVDKAPHEMSTRYVVGLIGLCVLVFIIVAISIAFKSSQEEVVDTSVSIPTIAPKPTAMQAFPTDDPAIVDDEAELLTFEDEEDVDILAQAPSPTSFIPTTSPTTSISLVPTTVTPTKLLTLTPVITSAATATPTKKATTPTLLKTGGDYNASLFAAVISFALIAIAFMF